MCGFNLQEKIILCIRYIHRVQPYIKCTVKHITLHDSRLMTDEIKWDMSYRERQREVCLSVGMKICRVEMGERKIEVFAFKELLGLIHASHHATFIHNKDTIITVR